MEFVLTDDQVELRTAARHFLTQTYPATRIGEIADGAGHDNGSWPELRRQGWLEADLGMVELTVLAEEGGRALHPVPWWTTMGLASPVYQAAGLDLPGPVTLAEASDRCRARPHGDQWGLDGTTPPTTQANVVDEIVIAASTESGVALFGVRADAPGVRVAVRDTIDPLRTDAEVTLSGARGRLLAAPVSAGHLLARSRRRAIALLAGEAVGVADRALHFGVEHARTREQFGRPIGVYQAVSQPLAESYAGIELARSLAYRAACLLDDDVAGTADGADTVDALSCAAHAAGRAAVQACETAVQVCGGMGVTWEFPLHRWFRRALWLESVLTERVAPLATLAHALLDEAPHRSREDAGRPAVLPAWHPVRTEEVPAR